MLLSAKTRFKIGEAMDSGKIVIINNAKALLGDQGAEFFGRFFIAQVLAAAQARSGRRPEDKKPVYFYIDECQNVIARDERISTILDECRSQKVALILAHQRTEQIRSADVLSALSNCAVRYANSDDEAAYLAPRLRTTKKFLETLPRGRFAVFVRDLTSQAIPLSITPTDFSQYAHFSADEAAAFTTRMRSSYGRTDEPRVSGQHVHQSVGAIDLPITLEAARKQLADAIAAKNWARAGELEHSIIPELERKSRPSEPRRAPASRDVPRPVATSRDEPLDEGTTDWRE
jgi:hypothetical protein